MSDLQSESTQRWARLAPGGAGGNSLLIGTLTDTLETGGTSTFYKTTPIVDDDDNVSLEEDNTKELNVYDPFFLEPFNSPLAVGTRIYYTRIKGKNWYVRHACTM